jgi:hypothetical protein
MPNTKKTKRLPLQPPGEYPKGVLEEKLAERIAMEVQPMRRAS